jgi:uncharacterized protein
MFLQTAMGECVIREIHAASEALRTLNNEHAVELSALSLAELDQIIRASFFSAAVNDSDALLVAFDQSFPYQHENVVWFRNYFAKEADKKFVYVDRVVTAPTARGQGYARALYTDLFQRAKSAGHTRVVCEVNLEPPNPVSDAFHASLNFSEVGRGSVHNGERTVRYFVRGL